jgi:hypothetical protein
MSRREITAEAETEFFDGVRQAAEFFMGKADVQRALQMLADRLEQLEIPYAIVGAMAMNEYGYRRVTEDVDVLLTREGLDRFKQHWLGKGYVEKFEGSRGLRDTENAVPIDVIVTGDYPGDGRPKSVVFPDPADHARRGSRVRLLSIGKLIELKLASGMSAPHRLRGVPLTKVATTSNAAASLAIAGGCGAGGETPRAQPPRRRRSERGACTAISEDGREVPTGADLLSVRRRPPERAVGASVVAIPKEVAVRHHGVNHAVSAGERLANIPAAAHLVS